jgi:hypothetical protein
MREATWRLAAAVVAAAACGGGRAPATTAGGGAGSAAAGSAAAAEVVRISEAPHVLYEEVVWQRDQQTTVTFTDGGSPARLDEAQQHSCTIGTAELVAGEPSAILVAYPLQQTTVADGVNPPVTDIALQGNTYMLRREGEGDGELMGRRTDGAPMVADEVNRLRAHHVRLGRPATMLAMWASRPWRVGEPYALTEGELARYLNHPDEPSQTIAMTSTLTLVEETQLTFENVGRAVNRAPGGTDLTIEWRSKVLVARDGMREMVGTGTATGIGKFRGRAVTVNLTQTERLLRVAPPPSAGSGSGSAAPPPTP